uniref:Uncharacterized protein n=1 Tax=Schizaphis graminum TaxID=13262 RepID=A0A2S2PML9_SCHGA
MEQNRSCIVQIEEDQSNTNNNVIIMEYKVYNCVLLIILLFYSLTTIIIIETRRSAELEPIKGLKDINNKTTSSYKYVWKAINQLIGTSTQIAPISGDVNNNNSNSIINKNSNNINITNIYYNCNHSKNKK